MIHTWPPKPRYNTKKLREAVTARAQTDALVEVGVWAEEQR